MFAIQNKKTGKYITGTDFSHRTASGSFRQFFCSWPMKVYEEKSDAIEDFKRRRCGKDFEVVEV